MYHDHTATSCDIGGVGKLQLHHVNKSYDNTGIGYQMYWGITSRPLQDIPTEIDWLEEEIDLANHPLISMLNSLVQAYHKHKVQWIKREKSNPISNQVLF